VFVSVGHRADLDTACAITLRLAPRYRLPETTRRADHLSRAVLTSR
jgi:deoxyribonuclease V